MLSKLFYKLTSFSIAVVICLLIPFVLPADADMTDVVINEIFVNGKAKYPDWIELYNKGDEPVNLKGFYLSNSLTKRRWQVKNDLIVKPHDFRVIFCDKIGAYDHANFKLNSISGEAALFLPDGQLSDSIVYNKLPMFSSLGRYPDGSHHLEIYKTPSRNRPNHSGQEYIKPLTKDEISFSHGSGIYSESFVLNIESESGARLYYTLDGSSPSIKSRILTRGLKISKNTVIRVIAVKNSKQIGSATRSYIFDQPELPVISLVTQPQFLWNKDNGIYTDGDPYKNLDGKFENWRSNWKRPVNLTYIYNNQTWSCSAKFRIYGGASRGRPQKSFAIYTTSKKNPYRINFKLFPEVDRRKYAGIILRNGGDEWMKTQIRDGFQHTLIADRVACDYLPYRPVSVYLNGEYWGFYGMRELISKRNLLARHDLPLQKVTILDGAVEINADNGPFTGIPEIGHDSDYRTILSGMDIDSFLDYLIVETYVGNSDWPGNNIKCWRSENGLWKWVLFDLDRGLNGRGDQGIDWDPFGRLQHLDRKTGLLFGELSRNKEFVRDFCARMSVHMLTTFAPKRASKLLTSMKNEVRPEIGRHIKRWRWEWDPRKLFMSIDKWETYLEVMRDYCNRRPASMLEMMDKYFKTGSPAETDINVQIQGNGRIYAEGVPLDEGRIHGLIPENLNIRVKAEPAEGYRFDGWASNTENKNPEIKVPAGGSFNDTAIFKLIK